MGLLSPGSGLMTHWTTSRRFFHLRAALCPNLTKFQFCDSQSPTSELSHISRVSSQELLHLDNQNHRDGQARCLPTEPSLDLSTRIWIKCYFAASQQREKEAEILDSHYRRDFVTYDNQLLNGEMFLQVRTTIPTACKMR